MVNRNVKLYFSTFILGLILCIGTLAYSASAVSPRGYYGPILGYSYQNSANVSNDTRVYASTKVDAGEAVPTGYMGAQARLFRNDALYVTTTMTYNNTSAWSMSVPTGDGKSFPSGTYYSKGITAAYNGDGYSNYYTFQSPSINH